MNLQPRLLTPLLSLFPGLLQFLIALGQDRLGAVVKVITSAGAQYNHMTSSVGYASSSYGPVHFGLGNERLVAELEIRWPSGIVQKLRSVPGDRMINVKESAG